VEGRGTTATGLFNADLDDARGESTPVNPSHLRVGFVVVSPPVDGKPDAPAESSHQSGEMLMDKLLLTPREAAEVLSVSRSKLYQLLAAGELQSVRIDGCRRVAASELRRYVERLGAEQGPPADVAA
jgi:excisionase family DNA binding protein